MGGGWSERESPISRVGTFLSWRLFEIYTRIGAEADVSTANSSARFKQDAYFHCEFRRLFKERVKE